ncbi:hypothetical protein NMG29_02890 [Streptomyces cocklensis]|uniref:Uncharacterized protein n=1 Tax=Actinacidiphila cocklensis TaxID=887465 RepID=A0A9W4GS47_9ACTN|nr:hypothetical protein [Actinacidiphila cocklensis]MDD1057182.1 hypothetical protein [Actinacidiphila cocklensis]CAG6395075.1 conserved hypothetical protein [Actinacidiphila cocklensis]
MLESVVSPDWESRYHSFNSTWAPGQQMASMRDGSGNEWSAVFSAAGAYVRGFDHESPMSPYGHDNAGAWPGVLDTVPEAFREFVEEPAFCDEDGIPVVTVCLWRTVCDDGWRTGAVEFPEGRSDPDGADRLFELLVDRSPDAYLHFAQDYYETSLDRSAVAAVLSRQPLTAALVTTLNPETSLADLAADLAETGYAAITQSNS